MARKLSRKAEDTARLAGIEMIAQDNSGGEPADRRAKRRARTLKGGRIFFNAGYSAFDCTVRNMSDTGAQLQVANSLGIPAHFDLDIVGEPRRKCTIRWRTERAVGVSFD